MKNLKQAVELHDWTNAYIIAHNAYNQYADRYALSANLDDLNAAQAFKLIRDSIKSALEELQDSHTGELDDYSPW